MNEVIKIFYDKRQEEDFHFANILDTDFKHIPINKKGVYILVAKDDSFIYPSKQKSKVFYIGMSKNLKKRLRTHKRKTLDLVGKNHSQRRGYWYRYQYAASFGADIYVFLCKGSQQPKNLEYDIIEHFYDKYLGKPVTIGAFSFKK